MPMTMRRLLGLVSLIGLAWPVLSDSTTSTNNRSFLRSRQTEEACPALEVRVDLSLHEPLLNSFYQAIQLINLNADLSEAELIQQNRPNYQVFRAWKDLDDRHILAKTNDECYVAFGVPKGHALLDQLQNLNPLAGRVGDSNCVVRRGWLNGYNTSRYADNFAMAVEDCVESCGRGTPCPLYLTGYSQGGAIAITAGIDLRRYNPTIVTFGATTAIINPDWFFGDECTDFDPTRHYQFVNMVDGKYDWVAMSPSPFGGQHFGRLLLLDEETSRQIGSPGLLKPLNNQGNQAARRQPWTNEAHEASLYKERLERVLGNPCGMPVAVGKWPASHACHYDDECDSNLCQENVCS